MPYSITWEPRGAWILYHGSVRNSDLVDSMRELLAHPDFEHFRYYVAASDETIDLSSLSNEVILEVADLHLHGSDRNPHICGIVVARTALGKGLTGVYYNWHQAKGGRWTIELLASEAEAHARTAALVDGEGR